MPSTLKGIRDESIAREKVEGRGRAVTGSALETVVINTAGSTPVGGDISGTVGNAQIVAGAVDTTELADGAVTTAKIDTGAVTATELATDAVTNAKVANNAIDTAEIVDNAVTNAKAANMAAHTIKSNITGSSADPSDNSLTAILDAEVSSTQGSIAYRNGTTWVALAPGTSGHFLKTNGAGANPSWSAGGGGASAFTDLTDTFASYSGLGGRMVKVKTTEDGLEATNGTTEPLQIGDALSLTNEVTDTISGHLTDYAPTGHASATWFLLTVGGSYELRSLAGGDSGRIVFIYNNGTNALTIKDNYTSGTTAAMRFDLPHDIPVYPNETVMLRYDNGVGRWWAMSLFGLKITSGGAELVRRLDLTNTATVNLALSTLTNGVTELTATVNDGSITEAKLLLADNTTANVSTSAHGYTPKAPNDATKFLDGTGAWDTVKDSDLSTSDITTNNVTTSKHGFVPKAPNDTSKKLDGTGAWGNGWTKITKTSDESRNTNAALTADSDLVFAMAASTKYHIRGTIFYDTVAAADFKNDFTGPTSPTLVRLTRLGSAPPGTSTARQFETALGTVFSITGTSTGSGWMTFECIVHNAGNTGNFTFRWAQDTSNGSNTTVLAGSYLEYSTV